MTLLDAIGITGIPAYQEITLITFILSLLLFIVNKKLVNQDRLAQIRLEIKQYQDNMKAAQKENNPEKIKQLDGDQSKMMSLTKEMMSMTTKPMLYTTIPFLLIYGYLGSVYASSGIVITLPVVGGLDWVGWYIITAVFFGAISEYLYQHYRKRKRAKIQ